MNQIEVLKVNEKASKANTTSIQRANSLFRFVDKLEYLLQSIQSKALVSRYCSEDITYLDIGKQNIAYPILCFCDINLHKLDEHLEIYGKYGIAFSKEWGIKNGIQPIQYINSNSYLSTDFKEAFLHALKNTSDEIKPLSNYLLTNMHYLKPIQGDFKKKKELIEDKNFTDECEWRYVANVKELKIPPILIDDRIASSEILNETLANKSDTWLKFEYSDIKYLIVDTYDDFDFFLEEIHKLSMSDIEKYKLISKILIWSESKGDF